MEFHLQFSISPFSSKLNYEQSAMFVGSCFAENIGEELRRYKFNVTINPHGVLYNPASLATAIARYISNESIKEDELFYANDCWNSWEHHSRFSNPDKQLCLNQINQSIQKGHHSLKQASWLFITLGSAFVYQREGNFVGNCHKQPASEFEKKMLDPNWIVVRYQDLVQQLYKFNPNLTIVFSVSPVRYIRDGVVENNRSKAVLIQAVHQLKEICKQVNYFPAYELVMDDLRDYRFFKEDMVHPNEQAIAYVFDKFRQTFFDEPTKTTFQEIKQIVSAREHRPLQAQSSDYKRFKGQLLKKTQELQEQFPFLNLVEELSYFAS